MGRLECCDLFVMTITLWDERPIVASNSEMLGVVEGRPKLLQLQLREPVQCFFLHLFEHDMPMLYDAVSLKNVLHA